MTDALTPRQRLLRTMTGRDADRVPLLLEGFGCVGREGLEAIAEPGRRDIAERLFDQTTAFVGCESFVNRYLVTPPQCMRGLSRDRRGDELHVTTEIATPKGPLTAVTGQNPLSRTVWTIKYPVESLADVEKIRSVPWERPEGLAPPDATDLPEGFDRKGVLWTCVSSPFVCVAGMMPYQYFLQLCATEPELLEELTDLCCGRILDLLEGLLGPGTIEYVWMGGCEWVTPPMASPEVYDRLVQPFEERVISRIHAGGAIAHVHCHGNVRSTLEKVIRRGGDYFEPVEPPPDGDISFAEAKALAAGRITLGGNIEARVLERASPEAVEQATRAAFEGGKHRMVLANSTGPIGEITPPIRANYHRMIDVWEQLSPI